MPQSGAIIHYPDWIALIRSHCIVWSAATWSHCLFWRTAQHEDFHFLPKLQLNFHVSGALIFGISNFYPHDGPLYVRKIVLNPICTGGFGLFLSTGGADLPPLCKIFGAPLK